MGHVQIVDSKLGCSDVDDALALSLGYQRCDDGSKNISIGLIFHAKDGKRRVVSYSIEPEDVQALADAMIMLRDAIGTGQWPDDVFD
jgi:hypothetical protein